MSQLSLFSAGARPPRADDLAGLLCGPGRIVRFGSGDTARLSIVLPDPARAPAVVAVCRAVGIEAERVVTESGATMVRTAFRRDLVGLARTWTQQRTDTAPPTPPASSKTVPPGMMLDGPVLRVWMLAAGRWDGHAVELLLDPHAPGTHLPLVAAATRAGIAPARTACGTALRIGGARRLRRLGELLGPPPPTVPPDEWPGHVPASGVDAAATLPTVRPSVPLRVTDETP